MDGTGIKARTTKQTKTEGLYQQLELVNRGETLTSVENPLWAGDFAKNFTMPSYLALVIIPQMHIIISRVYMKKQMLRNGQVGFPNSFSLNSQNPFETIMEDGGQSDGSTGDLILHSTD